MDEQNLLPLHIARFFTQQQFLHIRMIEKFEHLSLSSQDYLFSQINDSQLSPDLISSPPIRKLDCINLRNFKSFDNKYIGPFLDFTCIIGPNGSGKSNILQALMFCFCSEGSRHSLIDVRELINRDGKQTFKELAKQDKVCSVQAVFVLRDDSKFAICRTLDPEGKENFSVNYQIVPKKIYQNILLRKGINCHSPNYAIWQGQIDRLLLKEPTQLTALFQNLSGSIYFKKPYDEAKQKRDNIQEIIEQKTKKITKFRTDRKNLKNAKNQSLEYNKFQDEYQEVMGKIYYLRVLEKELQLQQIMSEYKTVQKQEGNKIEKVNKMKIQAQKDHQTRKQLQKNLDHVRNELAQMNGMLKDIGNPANILKIQQLRELETEIRADDFKIDQLENRKHFLIEGIPEIPSSNLIEQYLSYYERWEQQNSALHRQLNKKKADLLYIEGNIQSKHELIADFDEKKKKAEQRKAQKKGLMKDLQKDAGELQKSIMQMKDESEYIIKNMERGKKQFDKKNKQYTQICANIEELQNVIASQANDEKEASLLKNLGNIEGFQGSIDQKISPTTPKYQICFSVIFSTINKYLLCSDQISSRRIGDRLIDLNLMKNVVILQNVNEQRSNELRRSIGRDGILAIDIVEYDEDLKGLKGYLSDFLHGKVVCDDMRAATRLREKRIEGVREIYTLDGNIFRKDGTISAHGNPESLKKIYKYSSRKKTLYEDLSKLNKDKLKLQNELQKLGFKYDDKQIVKKNLQIDQMIKKKQQIMVRIADLSKQTNPKSEVKAPNSVLAELKTLEKQRDKLNQALGELEQMVRNSNIFDSFMEKHQISSLQAFRNANNFDHIEMMLKKKQQIGKQVALIQAEIDKIKRSIKNKEKVLHAKQQQFQKIPHANEKQSLEQQIKNKEKQMVNIHEQMSKLVTINQNQHLNFQSKLPVLEAKIQYHRQKIPKELEDIAEQYGIPFKYPVSREEIGEELNIDERTKITQTILNGLYGKLQKEKERIEHHLDKHNTLHVLDKVEEDEQRLEQMMKQTIEQVETMIQSRKKLSEELQTLRKDRATVLVQFIDKVKPILNESYRMLTKMSQTMAGTADLHIENNQYPFDYGVYFSPTPPTKRFVYDLEQLSGGQKSLASLALQYSLAIATKVSFLMLDETDAFLDSGNVVRFLSLVDHSVKEKSMQIIVVSHKKNLFKYAQSLVGVCRPKQIKLSQIYSLKL